MDGQRFKNEKEVYVRTHISIDRISVNEPGPMHLHEFYELEIILSGKGYQNLNGSVYPLQPGTVYLLTPIDFHAIIPEESLVLLNLSFATCMVSSEIQTLLINERFDWCIQASDQQRQTLELLVDMLSKECASETLFSFKARRNLLELILFDFIRSRKGNKLSSYSQSKISESLQYLFSHFTENITLSEVASQCGYTPNHFSKIFRETCGTPFQDFLAAMRINYAKMLLLSTSLSITEIAEKCGFASTSGFFRRFHQSCGCTPISFRKENNTVSR